MTTPVAAPRERALGEYQLLAKLATGGMAEIFLARKRGGDQQIQVVKRILAHLADDEHFVTMFRDEAQLASQLVHPNICRVHELGHVGDVWFIVMEYLHGVALSRLLSQLSKRRQFLDVRTVAGLMVQACDGLEAAHEARGADGHPLGVVHRDVSPPNILLTVDGTVKLLDFGIAKARGANSKTRTGTVKGKNAYMSPEQILGKALDRRSDVFALAAVMYELLAVRRLFHRDSDFLTFKAITEEPIPDIRERRSDLPPQVIAVLTQALARDPAARFPTAVAMRDAIIAATASLGGPASPDEIKTMLARDFADELASKDALVADAARLHDDDAPLTGPGQAAPPTPVASISALAREDSDFFDRTPVARAGRAQTGPADDRPSTSVFVDGPAAPGVTAAPTSVEMLRQPDPTTDLLRDRRRRAVRFGAGLVVVVALVAVVFKFGLGRGLGLGGDGDQPAAAVAVAAPIDAGVAAPGLVPVDAAVDADQTRADITALARYGFFSIGSDKKAVIYIDHKRIAEAPLIRYPLEPGPHQIKAVGPRNKAKRFDVMIEATKDVDLGVIEW
ncbi:MAG: protein kinase [Myxococcales bacterium]|nr:protein kinase [Myxococcales bacterium]